MPTYPTSDPVDNILRSESYEEIVDLLNVPSFDVNGNIEFQSIVLADTGNVALTAGALGLNSNGELIKHNGLDIGNDLPIGTFSTKIAGVTAILAAQNGTGKNYCLDKFRIPASEAVDGTRYRVLGNITLAADSGGRLPAYTLGFCPFLSASIIQTSFLGIQQLADPPAQYIPTVNMEMVLQNKGSNEFILSAVRGSFGTNFIFDTEDNVLYMNYSKLASSDGGEYGRLNESQDIGLFYTVAGGTGYNSVISYDFTITKI